MTQRSEWRDRIVLSGLAFEARHGVFPAERTVAQRFEVDVELELDLAPAGRLDDLRLTTDYGPVAEAVRDVVEGPSVDLLETLAERTAAAVLTAAPKARAVVVRIRKPDVVLAVSVAFAGVEIRREQPQRPAS